MTSRRPGRAVQLGVIAGALGIAGCGGDSGSPTGPPPALKSVVVSPPSYLFVFAGDVFRFRADAQDANGKRVTGLRFTWTSSDSAIVAVDSVGVVTARAEGRAKITATVQGVSGSATPEVDYSQAKSRCTNCHSTPGQHRDLFAGATCPSCHAAALRTPAGDAHEIPEPGHPKVAREFALTGVHDTLLCTRCHDAGTGAPLFKPASTTDCYTCHAADYERRHGGSSFPTTCINCHSTSGFKGAASSHTNPSAKFPLVGRHASLACDKCHDPATGRPRVVPTSPTDCVACHRANYEARHAGSGYPTTCASCHTTSAFAGASFNHATATRGRFTLLGVHLTKPCTVCHDATTGAPQFSPANQNDCITCHRADYERRHGGSSYPTTCLTCHTTDRFAGARFDHASPTAKFPLVGTHATLPCERCHDPATGRPRIIPASPSDCIACHRANYDARHAGNGYPTKCLSCHNTTRFAGARFDHAVATSGKFTLIGAHASKPCTVCHDATTGVPRFAPSGQNDCITCHRADYTRQHGGSGYPTTCLTCHTTNAFAGASFDHDRQFFPIFSGEHRGRWSSCSQCHIVASDFSRFSCLGCHSRSETDAEHRDRAGYAYDSRHCLSCHPHPG